MRKYRVLKESSKGDFILQKYDVHNDMWQSIVMRELLEDIFDILKEIKGMNLEKIIYEFEI